MLRALNQLWSLRLDAHILAGIGQSLGADVPACVYSKPCLMQGIGEQLSPYDFDDLAYHLLLAKPPAGLSTQTVYRSLKIVEKPIEENLFEAGNDLQPVAELLCMQIKDLVSIIAAQPECLLARMTGSGSACFGLFANQLAAQKAQRALNKDYWSVVTSLVQ